MRAIKTMHSQILSIREVKKQMDGINQIELGTKYIAFKAPVAIHNMTGVIETIFIYNVETAELFITTCQPNNLTAVALTPILP